MVFIPMSGSGQRVPGWKEAAIYNPVHTAMRGRVGESPWVEPDHVGLLSSPAPGPVWKLGDGQLSGKIPEEEPRQLGMIAWPGCQAAAGREGGTASRRAEQGRAAGIADPLTPLPVPGVQAPAQWGPHAQSSSVQGLSHSLRSPGQGQITSSELLRTA